MGNGGVCRLKRVSIGSYEDVWKSDCGKTVVCESPMDVGFSFAPIPSFNFCPNCGKKCVLIKQLEKND